MTFMCFPTFSDMYKQYHLSYEFFDLLSNFFRKLNKRFEICTAAPSRKIKRIGKEEDWKYYDFYVFPTFSDMYKQYHLSYEFFDLL